MIAGTDVDSLYFSEEPKGLYPVQGQTHFSLYNYVDGHVPKLIDFFAKPLA